MDPAIFTLRYFTHCMACGFCRDACCDHGVDVDLGNVARLKALPRDFHDRIGVPAREWFTGDVIQDPEFPGGAHVRTPVKDGACVFRNPAGRGCAIHAYCLEQGLDYHALKPMVSVLFPLTFEQGVLDRVRRGGGRQPDLRRRRAPAFMTARATSSRYYFGAGLIAELDALNARHG